VVPAPEILAKAGIRARRNIWLQDVRAAERRVETIPYILQARVHRSLPGAVTIVVSERVPYAVVHARSGPVLIDRELRVLGGPQSSAREVLPDFAVGRYDLRAGMFLRSERARRMGTDFGTLTNGHVFVDRLGFDRFGDLAATLRGGVRLLLGDDADLAKKTGLVDPVLAQLAHAGRAISILDLRAPGTPIVVYKK